MLNKQKQIAIITLLCAEIERLANYRSDYAVNSIEELTDSIVYLTNDFTQQRWDEVLNTRWDDDALNESFEDLAQEQGLA